MPHHAPDKIRNVALIGHRGSGKTSVCEAILFEAGVVNRLGRVEDNQQEQGERLGRVEGRLDEILTLLRGRSG